MAHYDKIYQFLTLDGTGDIDDTNEQMAVDGTTPKQFWIGVPAANNIILLKRLIFQMRDNGTWSSEKYGAITAGLTNGVTLKVMDTTMTTTLLNLTPKPIQSNNDWSGHGCYDASITSVGAGDSFLSARWSFFKDNDDGGLFLHKNERMVMTIADAECADLVDQHANVRGSIVS